MGRGIRVNAIAPGLVDTDMSRPLVQGNDKVNERNSGKPEEIASVVAMICSDDGSFINGETLIINGSY